MLNFFTADDPGAAAWFTADHGLTNLSTRWPINRLRAPATLPMLRRVTQRGAAAGGQTGDWYVTPLVLEGRS